MNLAAMTPLERTRLTQKDEDRRESRFTQPRKECPHPEWWTAEDCDATENEVIEGVAGLVRLLQPDYVIETGTHRGLMAEAIARALLKNGHGHLDTIEIEADFCEEARGRIENLTTAWVHHGSSLEFRPDRQIDFAWLDSGGGKTRFEEFFHFAPWFHSRTIIGFHDTGTHNHIIRRGILELNERGMIAPIFLPTPRGVALCQVNR